MKIILKVKTFALLCFITSINTSCSSDDSVSQATLVTLGQTALTNGTWKVSFYSENNVNKTTEFSGYNFVFTPTGPMMATSNATEFPGVWVMGVDSGSAKLNLTFFATNGPLEEITEDWNVLDVSTNIIKLKHLSGGDGTTELLTFERN